MSGYYSDKLSAEQLRHCYEIAPPRVQQYLDAEIAHIRTRIKPGYSILELGCGYGRVLRELTDPGHMTVGIDTSTANFRLAIGFLRGSSNWHLCQMNAMELGFQNHAFNLVACIQNGISAFKVDQRRLIAEAIRVTRPGGLVLFSTYSPRFWQARLEWFQLQADAGLLGTIDTDATGDGTIVCKDGFKATTVPPDEFASLTAGFTNASVRITEVDQSSLFCEIQINN